MKCFSRSAIATSAAFHSCFSTVEWKKINKIQKERFIMDKKNIPEEFVPIIKRILEAIHPELKSFTEEQWKEVTDLVVNEENIDIEPNVKN